jgi:hypothetical protein
MFVKPGEELLTLNIDRRFSNPYLDLALIPLPHSPLAARKTTSHDGNTEGFALPASHAIRTEQHWPDSSPPSEQTPHIHVDVQIGNQLVLKL